MATNTNIQINQSDQLQGLWLLNQWTTDWENRPKRFKIRKTHEFKQLIYFANSELLNSHKYI